jgi:uncharacterized coiled-coil protein SlyX
MSVYFCQHALKTLTISNLHWSLGEIMADNTGPKDDTLEALDFLVNALKEHEKSIDKLIDELAVVTEQLDDVGKLSDKVEKVEEKVCNLQKEIKNLVSTLGSKEGIPAVAMEQAGEASSYSVIHAGPSVVLRCKQWEDFQTLAFHAQTISFVYKEDEKVFQVDALKDSRVVTYSGILPMSSSILRMWLTGRLNVPVGNILEGNLAVI